MFPVQPPAFGELLKRYRSAAGLTQEALAERAGMSARGISDLERGVRRLPRKDTVGLLADALGLAVPERTTFAAAARRLGDPAPSPAPLVGRVRELALLERHLAGLGPPVLLLAGEPGIGKTSLLCAAARRAPDCGWSVLEGGCQRRGGQESYAPLLQALERHFHHRAPARLGADLRDCAWLVRLLPELAAAPIEPLPAWTLAPEQERRLMFGAVARFLGNVAGPAGTLLLLDDLQWAGSDALDLLATLVRSTEAPLRVVGAYRDTEVQPQDPLSVTLADLAHARLVVQHTVVPLAPDEVRQLLEALLLDGEGNGAALRERMLRRTGGVPFFVVSCAEVVRLSTGDGGRDDAVPWDVAQSVRQRLAALPEVVQEVLGAAAVAGRAVRTGLLAAVSGHTEREVSAALRTACRSRLLVEAEDPQAGRGYQFAHDVIREVVEADLGEAQRTILHRRIAKALEGGPGDLPVELLAYHYSRSEERDKAVRYLEPAGDRAWEHHASVAAAGYYQELVECLDGLGRALDSARAREKLGAALRTAAQYDAALAVLERAAETYRAAGDLESLGRVAAQIGWAHSDRGTQEEGIARLQPLAEPLAAQGPSHGLAALYAALSTLFFQSGRLAEQLAVAERAVVLGRALQDERILAEAEGRRGLALSAIGRSEEALPVLEEAIRRSDAVGDLTSLYRSLNNLSGLYENRGEFAHAAPCSKRALEVAERMGNPDAIAFMTMRHGHIAFFLGDWHQARAHFERALVLSREIGASTVLSECLNGLGGQCLCEGAWKEASRYLRESLAMAERSGDRRSLQLAQLGLAELDLPAGHPGAARERLVALFDQGGLDKTFVGGMLALLAQAHLDLDDVDKAEEIAAQANMRARTANQRPDLVEALRVQVMVATRQGRWAEAERSLEEGLALAQSMPYPYAEARLLHVYGQMHAQKGEPEPARERLEAALAIFRRLGARKDAERVEQHLAVLPLR